MERRDRKRGSAVEFSIGARLRARRRQLGLSQTDLAKKLGVSFQQVQKYERGTNRIAASTLVAAADALATNVGSLAGEDANSRAENDELFRALAKPGAVEMVRAFDGIGDSRTRSALLMLTQEMARGGE